MRLLGFEITRTKGVPATLSPPQTRSGWYPIVREPYTGAWQENVQVELSSVLTHSTVFACISLIASDIAKMRLRLVEQVLPNIWEETESPAFSPVLRKPNRYQTRIKFVEQWILSKLTHGNTYAFKQRDNRGIVTALYVLDPQRVAVLVAPDGAVYYELKRDDLSGLGRDSLVVPTSEIIHDVMIPLYHPLVGVSPITACGLAASMGLKIQTNSALLFANGSQPSGILMVPTVITDEQAARLKASWVEQNSGTKFGGISILTGGLKYETVAMNAVDAQLIEQLQWTSETVCSCFHVPPYMVGVGPPPNYNNIEALNQQYYSQCLQSLVESMELVLDEGLELPKPYGTEFDLDDLLRMDSKTMMEVIGRGVQSAIYSPNEGRGKVNLKPTPGGETPYLQIQNFSLEALARRDAAEPAPMSGDAETETTETTEPDDDEDGDESDAKAFQARFSSALLARARYLAVQHAG
jgi:HK97 family phage portal protein